MSPNNVNCNNVNLSIAQYKKAQKLSFSGQNNFCSNNLSTTKLSQDNYKAYFMHKNVSFGKKMENPSVGFQVMETDGTGSLVTTPVGIGNFTKYGGFSVANPSCIPGGNDIIVPAIKEVAVVDGKEIPLNEIIYGGNSCDFARKSKIIKSIDTYPVSTWEYDLENGKKLIKQIAMPRTYDEKSETYAPAGTGSKMVIGYTNPKDSSGAITLKLNPLLNWRNFHELSGPQRWERFSKDDNKAYFKAFWGGKPEQVIMTWVKTGEKQDHPIYHENGDAGEGNLYFRNEDIRGQNHTIGAYKPGNFLVTLQPGESFSLTTTIGDDHDELKPFDIKQIVQKEKDRLDKLFNNSGLPDTDNARSLVRSADQFIVHRKSKGLPSIIAGYPWFKDWSRDAMISIPGLLIATKRFDDAKGVMTMWSQHLKDGALPNTFDFSPDGTPGYGGMDGTLYWFKALDEFKTAVKADGKEGEYKEFITGQYKLLKDVVEHHIYGRNSHDELINGRKDIEYGEKPGGHHGIIAHAVKGNDKLKDILGENGHERMHVGLHWKYHQIGMDSDGLIAADEGNLTWMDSKTDEVVHAPRDGKAVEINALWYNGLCLMKELANEAGDNKDAEKYEKLAGLVKESMQKFVKPDGQGLYDLIDLDPSTRGGFTTDGRIRPNQVIAVSLNNSPFDEQTTKSVLKVTEEKLLTPMGLRTLDPSDLNYQSHYADFNESLRESQYHKGIVWPWLIGPFCNAYLKANGNNEETQEKVYGFIKPLLDHMNGENGMEYQSQGGSVLGGIAEIADSSTKTGKEGQTDILDHMAKGCFSQAWSIASVLDVYKKVGNIAEKVENNPGQKVGSDENKQPPPVRASETVSTDSAHQEVDSDENKQPQQPPEPARADETGNHDPRRTQKVDITQFQELL